MTRVALFWRDSWLEAEGGFGSALWGQVCQAKLGWTIEMKGTRIT